MTMIFGYIYIFLRCPKLYQKNCIGKLKYSNKIIKQNKIKIKLSSTL